MYSAPSLERFSPLDGDLSLPASKLEFGTTRLRTKSAVEAALACAIPMNHWIKNDRAADYNEMDR